MNTNTLITSVEQIIPLGEATLKVVNAKTAQVTEGDLHLSVRPGKCARNGIVHNFKLKKALMQFC